MFKVLVFLHIYILVLSTFMFKQKTPLKEDIWFLNYMKILYFYCI